MKFYKKIFSMVLALVLIGSYVTQFGVGAMYGRFGTVAEEYTANLTDKSVDIPDGSFIIPKGFDKDLWEALYGGRRTAHPIKVDGIIVWVPYLIGYAEKDGTERTKFYNYDYSLTLNQRLCLSRLFTYFKDADISEWETYTPRSPVWREKVTPAPSFACYKYIMELCVIDIDSYIKIFCE